MAPAQFQSRPGRALMLSATAVTAVTVMTAAACSGATSAGDGQSAAKKSSTAATRRSATSSGHRPSESATTTTRPGSGPTHHEAATSAVRIALAGDTNTAGQSAQVLASGLGATANVLRDADVAMVNVETVIADDRSGLAAQPKAFNFVAPSRLLDVLARAGVDVVTVANNHGLDYGRAGLQRTLAARTAGRPHMIGAGADETEAFKPWRTVVRGRGVTFFGATDVIDDGLDWAAAPGRSGLASIKSDAGYAALRAGVREARAAHPTDVVVVYLHAGVELQSCPTGRQRHVAQDLASDGASAVVMSHAHVVEPGTVVGETAVSYGLGNFVFVGHSPSTSQTGVLQLDFPVSGRPRETWHPGRISSGLPVLLTGAAADAGAAAWAHLRAACGVSGPS